MMMPRHTAAALAFAALLALGNINVPSILPSPAALRIPGERPRLVMQIRELPFESSSTPSTDDAPVIPDHLVVPSIASKQRPRLDAPRTRQGWVAPVPDVNGLVPDLVQAGWFQGWTLDLPVGSVAAPEVHDGAVFIAGRDQSRLLHALDAATGIPLWTVRLSVAGPGRPFVSARYLALFSGAGTLFVLSTFDGSMQWSRRFSGPVSGRPMISGERLYSAGREGLRHLLSARALATGALHWRASLDGPILGDVVVRGDGVYLTTAQGSIYCLDRETGHERWSEPLGAWSAPITDGTQLLAACANPWSGEQQIAETGLLRVTLSAGLPFERVIWGPREDEDRVRLVGRLSIGLGFSGVPAAGYPIAIDARRESAGHGTNPNETAENCPVPGPWMTGDDVCLATRVGIRCADLGTGAVRWEWEPPDDQGPAVVVGAPAISGDLLVAASDKGDLAGLSRSGGEVLWTLRLGEPMADGPVLADGWVYVATRSGRIFGVDLSEQPAEASDVH